MLAAIVAIHECGHLVAAKSQGIHVTKFAIGFGPRLLSYQVGTMSGRGPICCRFCQLLRDVQSAYCLMDSLAIAIQAVP